MAAPARVGGPVALGSEANVRIVGGGYSVAGVGDVNGDGRDDVLVGSYNASGAGRADSGLAWIVFGQATATRVDLSPSGVSDGLGFVLVGAAARDKLGRGVARLGDVNADGRADFAVAAPYAHNNGLDQESGTGAVYVVFGKASTDPVDLAGFDGSPGAGGYRIDGIAANDRTGESLSGVGDMNGDGRPELAIDTEFGHGTYVVFGKASTGTVHLADFDGSQSGGFRVTGTGFGSSGRHSVAGVGDMNGDGRAELIVAGANGSGASVVFGKPSGATVAVDQLGAGGFALTGAGVWSVAGTGDVNGDGRPDLIVGSPFSSNNGRTESGSAYVVFGKSSTGSINLGSFDGSQTGGYRIDGANLLSAGHNGDRLGISVAGVGDVNADGRPDTLVGSVGTDNNMQVDSGSAYLIFGKSSTQTVDTASFDGTQSTGFRMDGASSGEGIGMSVADAGDYNADGRPDITTTDAFGNETDITYGYGPGPTLTRSPTSSTFADQVLGTTSASQTVTVSNTGTAALHVSSVSLAGIHPADFRLTSQSCTTAAIAPGQQCQVQVRFAPSALGERSARLSIASDAPLSPHSVPLDGVGVSAVQTDALAVAFGDRKVGSSGPSRHLTVTNIGPAALEFSQVRISGIDATAFSVESETCTTAPVASHGSCGIDLAFDPASTGARQASLEFSDDASDSPQSIPLTGKGTAPEASISPSSADFGGELVGATSREQPVAMTNVGDAEMVGRNATISGVDKSDFELTSDTCDTAMAPNASCLAQVRFTPHTPGAKTAVLQFDDDASGPHEVALTGQGLAPRVVAGPETLSFGGQTVGVRGQPRFVELKNAGTSPLHVRTIQLSGAGKDHFSLVTQTCTQAAVAPSGTCRAEVRFAPASVGKKRAELSLESDAFGQTPPVTLLGVGLRPDVRLPPDADGDGVPDRVDRCPSLSFDVSDRDGDGCPGPFVRLSLDVSPDVLVGRRALRLRRLMVGAPVGTRIEFSCEARCGQVPRSLAAAAVARRSAMFRRLRGWRMERGARFAVRGSSPNSFGDMREFVVRRGRLVRRRFCLLPGSRAPRHSCRGVPRRRLVDADGDRVLNSHDRCPDLRRGRFDSNGDGCPGPYDFVPSGLPKLEGRFDDAKAGIRITRLSLSLPPRARAVLRCSHRCHARETRTGGRSGRQAAFHSLSRHTLPIGARFSLTVTRKGNFGHVHVFTIKRKTVDRRDLCLPPGHHHPKPRCE